MAEQKLYDGEFMERSKRIPGTPVFIGRRRMEDVRISYIRYNPDLYEEKEASSPEECLELTGKGDVVWLNVTGIHDAELIGKLGDIFGLHSLTVEDVVNTMQRPKFEDFDSYLFMILKMVEYLPGLLGMETEQVSVILGGDFVITFQEKPGDVFDQVRERIRNGRGRIRNAGADFLAYSLIDAVVDSYFLVLESLGDRLDDLEDRIMPDPEPDVISEIHSMKRAVLFMRRTVWPLREEISSLEKSGSELVANETSVFLRNLYDHTVQVMDTIETYRDVVSGMQDVYYSCISTRMNEVMKVLTVIATIFIPLTFITGVYGMNFRNMPELFWEPGYFVALGVMLLIALSMLLFFKKKKWI